MRQKTNPRPRVGVPWRTISEEARKQRDHYDDYLEAVRGAGGEPVEISLTLSKEELRQLAESLDAVLLPGSPADVDPAHFGSPRHAKAGDSDRKRENTDFALLDHAFAAGKPVLGICYGAQLLNVHLGGSLVQDIPSEIQTEIRHDRGEREPDPFHPARIKGGRLAEIAGQINGSAEIRINTSHHQSVLKPGRGLRVTAQAPDGVIEAVEWIGGPNWVIGVQWHPERMRGDALADALLRQLVSEAEAVTHGK